MSIYDELYSGGYREVRSGFEIARHRALDHYISRVLKLGSAKKVLDYGAGSGLYVDLWEKAFRQAELHFCDISSVARDKFRAKHPRHADRYFLIHENDAAQADDSFDVIVSVEVMEHVEDLGAYLRDIARLLKPGGHFVWTTPCANWLSIEHVFSAMTGKIQQTGEGYRRWTWEDPTHLRRLRSREVDELLRAEGFSDVRFRFRSHVFSFVCTHLPTRHGQRFRDWLMTFDYSLLRCLPNGASMLGGARKSPRVSPSLVPLALP
jgi:ubiquinone/menaquinone biosynthesis C-methylase UbiE